MCNFLSRISEVISYGHNVYKKFNAKILSVYNGILPPHHRYDQSLKTPVRDVTHSESRSVFHVPSTPTSVTSATFDEDFEVIVSTKQFGVPLERLRERNRGDPIPHVLRQCMDFIEKMGMEVEGVFRRAPNTITMHQIEKQFDQGENYT